MPTLRWPRLRQPREAGVGVFDGCKGKPKHALLVFLIVSLLFGGEFLCATNGGNGLPGLGFVSVSLA